MKQVALFLIPVLSLPWLLLALLRPYAAEGALWPVLAWLLPVVWSPTIVALVLMVSVNGPAAAIEELKARLRYSPGSGRWLTIAGVVPVSATLAAVFIARSAGDGVSFIASAAIPVMFVLQVLTGAVGEELGWRGFLLPRLGKRFGQMTAAWVMGILWAVWHLPAFFFPGMPHETMPLVSNLLFTAFFGVFLAFVFNRTGESVLATMLAHLALNITSGIGGVDLSSILFWRAMVAIHGAVAVLLAVRSRFQSQDVR